MFQDPVASLNPSMSIGTILGEPLELHGEHDPSVRAKRCGELLEMVGLSRSHLDRYPHEFSGGQRQRIAIARALATSPRLIVLDEPVSALDVSTQASVMNLLEEVQAATGVAFLLIAHDLAVVRHASHRIVVMYRGRSSRRAPLTVSVKRRGTPTRSCSSRRSPTPTRVDRLFSAQNVVGCPR